jgi:hypothetical protein
MMANSNLQESQSSELLETFEIVPLQELHGPTDFQSLEAPPLGSLPAERWYETEGVAPGTMKGVGSDENAAGSRCPVSLLSTTFSISLLLAGLWVGIEGLIHAVIRKRRERIFRFAGS